MATATPAMAGTEFLGKVLRECAVRRTAGLERTSISATYTVDQWEFISAALALGLGGLLRRVGQELPDTDRGLILSALEQMKALVDTRTAA